MAKVRFTETALRDAHQSLLATRMRTRDMIPIAEEMDKVGYFSVEAWGGMKMVWIFSEFSML